MPSGARNTPQKHLRKTKAQLVEELEKLELQVADLREKITEGKLAEEALEENRRSLRAVIDAVPTMVSAKDRESRYIFMNRYQAELYGISPDNAVGKTASELVGAEHGSSTEAIDAEVLSTNQAKSNYEENWVDQTGHSHSLLTTKVPLRDTMGTAIGIVTVSFDITDRKQMEETLKDSEYLFRTVIDHLPLGLNVKDPDGRYLLVNETTANRYGLSKEDFIGKTSEDLFPEAKESVEASRAQELEIFKTNKGSRRIQEKSFQDGTLHTLLIDKFPIFDDEGNLGSIGITAVDITEQKEAEQAWQKSEQRLSGAIESLQEGFALFDADDRLVAINDVFRQINPKAQEFLDKGGKFEDILRANAAKGRMMEAIGREEDFIRERIEQHRNPKGQIIRQFNDGKWFILQEVRTPEGGIALTFVDITELKQSEEALKESQERQRLIFESSPYGVSVVLVNDPHKRIYVNPRFIEMFGGQSAEQLLERSAFDSYVDPKVGDQMAVAVDNENFLTDAEMERLRLDGSRWWCHLHRRPILFEGEDAIVNWHADITDRKQAQEALKESQARLANIMDNSPAPIYFKDTEGRFLVANRRYQEMYGVKFEDIKGKTSKEIFGDELGEAYFDHDQEILNSRKAIQREENYLGRTYLTLKFPIVDPNGMLLGLGGVETDITEIKAAEEGHRQALVKAEEANQAKSEFLATMSHELRTPLNAILGFADILYNQYLGPPGQGQYREYAGDIQASGEHLLELVNDLLDLSTIEAGKQSLVKEKLSTKEIVGECKKIMEEKAHSNGIDLITELPEDLPPLFVDRRAYKQILLNLLSNAVKFTPQGGKVTVSAKASKRNMTLKIADTGKGIPAEKLPKLTDPFTRAHIDPYLADKGWGLGLSITKSLVELHDGTMDIKSKVGKGTTVTVTLPNGAP